MADSYFRRINRDADNAKIIEYLDYLANRLSENFENIDVDNLSDNLKNKIGGQNERS